MASTAVEHLTAEEFWGLPDWEDAWLELVDGEVVEMPTAGGIHVAIMLHIFDMLRPFIREHNLGRIYPDSFGYLLLRDPDVLRIPDISFITFDRLPEDWPPVAYSEVVPDLVVEIVFPGNSAAEMRRRTRDYVDAGVSLIWIAWPEDRSVSVYAGSLIPVELESDDILDGGDVLPGFSIAVAELFAYEP